MRAELRRAQSYEEWKQTAKQLDQLLKFDDWKEIDEDGYFDFHLVSYASKCEYGVDADNPKVRRVKRTLTRLRAAKDTRGLMDALSVCVRSNFAGTESVKMYAEVSLRTDAPFLDRHSPSKDLLRHKAPGGGPYSRGHRKSRLRSERHGRVPGGEAGVLPVDQQELWLQRSVPIRRSLLRILPVRCMLLLGSSP